MDRKRLSQAKRPNYNAMDRIQKQLDRVVAGSSFRSKTCAMTSINCFKLRHLILKLLSLCIASFNALLLAQLVGVSIKAPHTKSVVCTR